MKRVLITYRMSRYRDQYTTKAETCIALPMADKTADSFVRYLDGRDDVTGFDSQDCVLTLFETLSLIQGYQFDSFSTAEILDNGDNDNG